MVHKIKFIKFITLLILLFTMTVFAFVHKGNIETNLLKTLLSENLIKTTDIITVADKSSSIIKVVFETENYDKLANIKKDFISSLDTTSFEVVNPDISRVLNSYISNPANFLSKNSRELIKAKKYDEIYNKSLERLYNPIGIQLTTIDKDPYLLLDDFITSNIQFFETKNYIDGKYYDFLNIKISDKNGLSPNLVNKKVSKIIKIQKTLSSKDLKIYLAGTPIHSYYTSIKSIIAINIICLLSTLLIIFLTYYYFKNIKMLIPIALSIGFGMLTGYVATRLWFNNFQIVTMVFSTTLIGIGVDYSFHYCFAKKTDAEFFKKLLFSFITTIIPFILLYFTNIELLKQISIFTIFGLFAIFLFIRIYYPYFNFPKPVKSIVISSKLYKYLFCTFLILGVIGFLKLNINNSITTLYMPSKNLLKAEALYNEISNSHTENSQIITIEGNNFEDLLEKEEQTSKNLGDIKYLAMSKFIPSQKKQKENFELVKQLYNDNPDKYSDILTKKQQNELKKRKFNPVTFDIREYPFLQDFLISPNKSFMLVYTSDKLPFKENYIQTINIKQEVEKYMKTYSNILLKFFSIFIILLTIIFTYVYKGVKLLIPPLVGTFLAIGLTSLFNIEINLFSIIALYTIFGFTIDYSIFRAQGDNQTEDAIFISSLTTSSSFLLLSLSGFKLLSTISITLFCGIICAYISGYLLFSNKTKKETNHEKI